ncbi:MAG: ABC transporter ATP-binding protein [Deltaproteobacteria bacterium]|nr:ABC transporter ATP-binding protein [Deltaproteobacteria bacterium]
MVISIRGLAKDFRVGVLGRRMAAVKDVSFDVLPNEVFGFIGPNGSGKSTTIHMLLGLVRPTRGGGTLLGHPLGALAARRQIGYLPELPNFYGYLKARELLEISGRLAGCDLGALRRVVPELLERVDLAGRGEDLLRTFSKGMLQRIGVAQALIGDPRLVILDEPMSGLDPLGRHIVRNVIIDLKARGRTVFFSSHIMPDIETLCDRVALIADGRTLRVASVEQLVRLGQERFEVQVRGQQLQPPAGIAGASWQGTVGDVGRVEVEGTAALQQVIDWGRSVGELLAVTPMRESLETVVVRAVATAADPAPKQERTP